MWEMGCKTLFMANPDFLNEVETPSRKQVTNYHGCATMDSDTKGMQVICIQCATHAGLDATHNRFNGLLAWVFLHGWICVCGGNTVPAIHRDGQRTPVHRPRSSGQPPPCLVCAGEGRKPWGKDSSQPEVDNRKFKCESLTVFSADKYFKNMPAVSGWQTQAEHTLAATGVKLGCGLVL